MPLTRIWQAKREHQGMSILVNFECPWFEELLVKNGGALTNNYEAHALFDYYGCALKAYDMAKRNIVLEEDLSRKFDREIARQLFQSKANQHGVRPDDMTKFWGIVMAQQTVMGGRDHLPEEFKFQYWGN